MIPFAMSRLPLLCLLALWLLAPARAGRATTLIPRDFDYLVARADTVFRGVVSGQQTRWVGEGASRHLATFVTFQVSETYKGTAAAEQTLRFAGGTLDGQTMAVDEVPTFAPGEESVLFVVNNGRQYCPLVGISQGRLRVVRDAAAGRERVFTAAMDPVADPADLGRIEADGTPRVRRRAATGAQAMTTDELRAAIRARLPAR